jgi:hypothetical protein
VDVRHGLAAILTMMTMRWTLHGIAALHRLFGLSHADAVERIRREGDGENREQNASVNEQTFQTKSLRPVSQGSSQLRCVRYWADSVL